MQRLVSSSTRASDEHRIDMPPFPMFFTDHEETPHPHLGRRDICLKRSLFSEKWIHLIPLILIICVFILWFYSHPVNVTIEEGRLVAVSQFEIQPLNNSKANGAAFSSLVNWESLFQNILFGNNTTEALLASKQPE